MSLDRSSKVSEALESDAARAILENYLPGIVNSPMVTQMTMFRLGQLVNVVPATRDDPALAEAMFAELAQVDAGAPPRTYGPARKPDPTYEDDSVPAGARP